jgi:hypothetical protein
MESMDILYIRISLTIPIKILSSVKMWISNVFIEVVFIWYLIYEANCAKCLFNNVFKIIIQEESMYKACIFVQCLICFTFSLFAWYMVDFYFFFRFWELPTYGCFLMGDQGPWENLGLLEIIQVLILWYPIFPSIYFTSFN